VNQSCNKYISLISLSFIELVLEWHRLHPYESALADVKSAIKFHIETFGPEQIDVDPPILEAFIAEAGVAV